MALRDPETQQTKLDLESDIESDIESGIEQGAPPDKGVKPSVNDDAGYKGVESPSESSPHEGVMTVVEHLDELRARLIRSLLYIVTAFIGMLFITKQIIAVLEKPAGNINFQVLSLEEPIVVFLKVAMYAGLIAASPLILWELAAFIAPGLTRRERKVMAPIIIGSPLLFVCGAAFAYFCLLPPMLGFFRTFGMGVAQINQRLDFYISLVSNTMMYLGLAFQMPVVIFALSFTGLVTSRLLLKIWRYAVVVITILAAVITPDPTAASMIIVMLALNSLYFLSVLLLKLFGK